MSGDNSKKGAAKKRGQATFLQSKKVACPLFFAWALFMLIFFAVPAQAVEVSSDLHPPTALIAEPISYTINLSIPEQYEFQFKEIPETLGNFTVRDVSIDEKLSRGVKEVSISYLLTVFETGDQYIPPVTIQYRPAGSTGWEEAQSEEQVVAIKSLLAEADEKAALRDIRGPRRLRGRFAWKLILFLLAAGALVWWWMKKKGMSMVVEPPQPVVPAHEIAYRELAQLAERDLVAAGKIKEYFIAVSGIVRRYLENRFYLRAPEMTTEEFLLHVGEESSLERDHKVLLQEFLECCDLVKFARYAPSKDEIGSVYASAKRFVDQTRERDDVVS